jgi:aminopeptidase N
MHALKLEVRGSGYFRALKLSFKSDRERSASTKDFIETIERVVGRDPKGFFAAWLSSKKVPRSRKLAQPRSCLLMSWIGRPDRRWRTVLGRS